MTPARTEGPRESTRSACPKEDGRPKIRAEASHPAQPARQGMGPQANAQLWPLSRRLLWDRWIDIQELSCGLMPGMQGKVHSGGLA